MTFVDLVRFSSTALLRQRLRSLLSLAGVAIGTCAVVLLTSLGDGARSYVVDQFATLGSNLLIVVPGKIETTGMIPGMGGNAPEDLTLDDARALERRLSGIKAICPVSTGEETVSRGERRRTVPILGSTHAFKEIRQLALAEGSFLPEGDMDRGRPVVVLGRKVAEELFPGRRAVGEVVRVGDWRMRVIGVMENRGMQLGQDMDDAAVIPVATCMKLFNRTSLFRILVQVHATEDLERTERQVLDIIIDRHDEEDVTCLTQGAIVGSLTEILGALTAALAGIGAISLTVAGIGIMNVMLVSVSERTFEIGLLQAVGAHRRQVLSLFLIESILLSLAGGVFGLAGAMAILEVTRQALPAFPVTAPPWAVVMALAVSVTVGALFGYLPAAKASRLAPVVALRGD